MKSKYIRSSEILEVKKDSIVVKIEFDIKEMVADFIGYADHMTCMIQSLATRLGWESKGEED